jgi:hypothetical protein
MPDPRGEPATSARRDRPQRGEQRVDLSSVPTVMRRVPEAVAREVPHEDVAAASARATGA